MKKLFTKISDYFKQIWYKKVTKPIQDRKKAKKYRLKLIEEANEAKRKIEKIRTYFEKSFKVSIDDVKKVMFHEKIKSNHEGKLNYLNSELIKGREYLLSNYKHSNKSPLLYEPEIVDIHNEHSHLNRETIGEIVKKEFDKASFMLREQTRKANLLELEKSKPPVPKKFNSSSGTPSTSDTAEQLTLKMKEKLKDLEKTLTELRTIDQFKEPIFKDLPFPEGLNIDDFPTIKKMSGK